MNTTPTMDNEQLARIRLVTRRYNCLQGIGRCFMGLGFVVGAGASSLVAGAELKVAVAALVWLAVAVPGERLSAKYYAHQFGRVAPSPEPHPRRLWIPFLFGGLPVVSTIAGPGFPHGLFLAGAFFLAWQIVQDWPLRKYAMVDVGAALLASALYISAAPDGIVPYFMMSFAIIGAAAMVTGALDHRLLVRTLPGVQDRQEHRYADTL